MAGFTQTYIADLTGQKQRNITMIESSRYRPATKIVKTLANFFSCSFNWLAYGEPPAYDQLWGYALVPPRGITETRKLNEINKILQTLFVAFLMENSIHSYYLVHEKRESAKNNTRLYIFPLILPTVFVLKANIFCWKAVDYALSRAKLKLRKEITMTPDEIDCIDDPQSGKTILAVVEKMLVTMDLAKPGIAKEQWIPLLEGKERLPKPEKILYDKAVNEICRLIVEKNIDIFDVIDNMKKYDRSYMTGSIFDDPEKLARIAKEYRKEK